LCDDQAIVLEGLRAILSAEPGIEVAATARNGLEALAAIPNVRPDLVLMDLKMPQMNGIQATRAIREQYPGLAVLVLTTYDADEWVFDAVRAGANGYLLKDIPQEDLVRAIRDTVAGRSPIDPQVAGKILSRVARQTPAAQPELRVIEQMSEREREILRRLGLGQSNAEIAQALFLSEGTVKNYVSAILQKLGVADRTQAAVIAVRAGLEK
jgi:DNA-binding NarL/FixJ family response regulator